MQSALSRWRFVFCSVFISLIISSHILAEDPVAGRGATYRRLDLIGPVGASSTAQSEARFLTLGPNTSTLKNGAFRATLRLRLGIATGENVAVGYIDVYDNKQRRQLAKRDVYLKDFDFSSTKDFDLTFVTYGSNDLEFRTYTNDRSPLEHISTRVVREHGIDDMNIESERSDNGHAVGQKIKPGVWLAMPRLGNGYLFLMPLPMLHDRGVYAARFSIAKSGNLADNQASITVDAYDKSAHCVLSSMHFPKLLSANTVEIRFDYDGSADLELRVFVAGHGSGNFELRNTTLVSVNSLEAGVANRKDATNAGKKQSLDFVFASTRLPPGVSTSIIMLQLDDKHADRGKVALIEAIDAKTKRTLAKRLIYAGDFKSLATPQGFDLSVDTDAYAETQIVVHAAVPNLSVHSVSTVPERLNLTMLWNETASFEFRSRGVFMYRGVQDFATSSLVALDGLWYAFNRAPTESMKKDHSAACIQNNRVPFQTVVRSSNDQGRSWTDPVAVAKPSEKPSAADYCAVLDGGAFFDAETDTWHYLAQCIGEKSNWAMCHFFKFGISPMGRFSRDEANPVVNGGQLWRQICDGGQKACPVSMQDEGTPQIIDKKDNYFYVSFHGANYGATVTGARGVARTKDFIHWETDAPDLPNDAILSAADCAAWRIKWAFGGCVGLGNARSLRSDGYVYMLAEAADISLICLPKQNWSIGLFRSTRLSSAGTWQGYYRNPFIVNLNSSPVGCALQYMNLVRDRGELYLTFSAYVPEVSFPNYYYQLVDGASASSVIEIN